MSGGSSKRKRKALGRGLDALLPEGGTSTDGSPGTLPVSSIYPNPDQPRKRFDPNSLNALARSIRERGVIQPIVVRPGKDGRWQIIAGERRWRAAGEAGLAEVPVIVRRAAEDEALLVSLVENLEREDLNSVEIAETYHRLMDEHAMSQDEVAAAIGKSRSAVANTLRLLTLPESVQRLVAEEKLSEGHARAVLQAEGANRQIKLAREVVKRHLSVRETERLARKARGSTRSPRLPSRSPEVRDLEEHLMRSLSARVEVRHGRKGKGSLIIHYGSLDELDGILNRMKLKKR